MPHLRQAHQRQLLAPRRPRSVSAVLVPVCAPGRMMLYPQAYWGHGFLCLCSLCVQHTVWPTLSDCSRPSAQAAARVPKPRPILPLRAACTTSDASSATYARMPANEGGHTRIPPAPWIPYILRCASDCLSVFLSVQDCKASLVEGDGFRAFSVGDLPYCEEHYHRRQGHLCAHCSNVVRACTQWPRARAVGTA
jgi:hypothetical protein